MNKKDLMKFKAILSLVLLVDFAIVMVTGIMEWAGNNRVAKLHTITGFLMGLIVTIHLIMNWKLLVGELTGKLEIKMRK